jgi:hypothetical protein
MLSFLVLASALSIWPAQTQASGPIDVSALKLGPPATVTELDLGKLKGDLRQIAWSPDGSELYVQTADGDPAAPKLRHYTVPSAGGAIKGLDVPPDWALSFWTFKSDRFAPGIATLPIEVQQKAEKTKIGTGSGRPGAGAGGRGDVPVDISATAEGQMQNVVRLTFVGEPVGEFVNERPIPGLTFSWGPAFSGAIAYTNRDGQLMLLDQKQHKQTVSGVKDALLPAWSIDGTRLAWVQKAGRKKYTLLWATVAR